MNVIRPFDNPNCDGEGPHRAGEVRRYPISQQDGSAALLCIACWNRENAWRAADGWPEHDWTLAR